jgi:hypothetical protein
MRVALREVFRAWITLPPTIMSKNIDSLLHPFQSPHSFKLPLPASCTHIFVFLWSSFDAPIELRNA